MSDPLKSADIEDVLSSIRRLVSEDSRLKPESSPRPEADRLVLTPALRVPDSRSGIFQGEDDPEETQDMSVADQDDPVEQPDLPPEHEPQLTDDLDAGDMSDLDDDTAGMEAPAAVGQPQEAAAENDVADTGDVNPEEEQVEAAQQAIDDIVEQAVRDATAEALGVEEPAAEEDTLEWEDHEADSPAQEPEQTEVEAEADQPAAGPEATDPAPAERAMFRHRPEDGAAQATAEDKDWNGTLYEAAARAGADVAAQQETGPDDQAGSFDFLGGDDAVLDEEALRELVADIVRQELQGALGERITRNVRKLVRREIHRALSAQDFD